MSYYQTKQKVQQIKVEKAVKLNVEQVKNLVALRGGWRIVYNAYPRMAEAVKAADSTSSKNKPQVPCPFTGDGKTKFRLFIDWEESGSGYHNDIGAVHGGISMVMELESCNCSEALVYITDACGGADASMKTDVKYQVKQPTSTKTYELTPDDSKKRLDKIKRTFKNCVPAATSEVIKKHMIEMGFKGDVQLLPRTLGYASELWYGDHTGNAQKLCGLLGIMSDRDNKNITLHRHFLDKATGKKADVINQKMLMKSPKDIRGCSIKLDEPFNYGFDEKGTPLYLIGYSEGVNTALAVREATGCPMEACYSSTLLALIEPAEHVTDVFIWKDKDKSEAGDRDAKKLREKLEAKGIRVKEFSPERDIAENEKSVDWHDVYNEQGPSGFPVHMAETNVKTGFDYLSAMSDFYAETEKKEAEFEWSKFN
jgi:putative DNA primase/helicase